MKKSLIIIIGILLMHLIMFLILSKIVRKDKTLKIIGILKKIIKR